MAIANTNTDNINDSPKDEKIEKIENLLGHDLKLSLDDYTSNVLILDDKNRRYGYVERDYRTFRFFNRVSTNCPLSCLISDIKGIALTESKNSLEVIYSDGSKGFYNFDEDLTPIDRELEIVGDKPYYDGSLISIENAILSVFPLKSLKNNLYFNVLDNKLYMNWELIGMSGTYPYNSDTELSCIIQILEEKLKYTEKEQVKHPKLSYDKVDKILRKLANLNPKNPFLEKIESAALRVDLPQHDISTFLRDVGISSRLSTYDDDDKYIRSVSSAIFLAIIERQKCTMNTQPIKFVPIIIGETNLGKSLICRILGLTEFHRETSVSILDEKAYNESVQGAVVVEQSEATHFVAGKEEAYKSHFGKNFYQYRKSYARESITILKRYLEIITSNDNDLLTDVTGNVRYYPIFLDGLEKPNIPIQEFDEELILSYYVDALEKYDHGERWYTYLNDEFQKLANEVRESVTREVDGLLPITDYLNDNYPNIGDFVAIRELKEILSQKPNYFDPKKVDKTIRIFSKACTKFGFRKDPQPHKVRNEEFGTWESVKGYIRVK